MARPGLDRHPKFAFLRKQLGSHALAVGSLEMIWQACYETGSPRVGTAEMVEALARWDENAKPPGLLFAALRDAGGPGRMGFIEPDPEYADQWIVHDLMDHAPEYVRKRRAREKERNGAARDRTTADIGGQCPPSHSLPAPLPKDSENYVSSALPEAGTPEPAVLTFPCSGKVREWSLSESQIDEWVTLYPGVAVDTECRHALAWVLASPDRRKTARGMGRFLTGWLGRATDRPKGGNGSRAESSKDRKEREWSEYMAKLDAEEKLHDQH